MAVESACRALPAVLRVTVHPNLVMLTLIFFKPLVGESLLVSLSSSYSKLKSWEYASLPILAAVLAVVAYVPSAGP